MLTRWLLRGCGALLPALGIAMAPAAPARAVDGAEVELFGYSISEVGTQASSGFPVSSPDLVADDDSEVPLGIHDDHEDAAFTRDRLYRNVERVNASHAFGGNGPARGTIDAGHSISVTTGWADAGSNSLGGWAESNAGSAGGSEGAATSTMRIEKRITILPGDSGLAAGELVTGLLWVLDGRGGLQVGGRSFPSDSAASAAATIGVLILRGPTGTCGAFDCQNGALAVSAEQTTSLAVTSLEPDQPNDPTARVTRHDTWNASNNTGVFKAGGVFDQGTTEVAIGLPVIQEDVSVGAFEGVDTAAPPLGLDAIEFEANVGETLKVQMRLGVYASLAGRGFGQSDFFGSFEGHVEDPQARGLVFQSSVPLPEPDVETGGGLAVLLLSLWRGRGAIRPKRVA